MSEKSLIKRDGEPWVTHWWESHTDESESHTAWPHQLLCFFLLPLASCIPNIWDMHACSKKAQLLFRWGKVRVAVGLWPLLVWAGRAHRCMHCMDARPSGPTQLTSRFRRRKKTCPAHKTWRYGVDESELAGPCPLACFAGPHGSVWITKPGLNACFLLAVVCLKRLKLIVSHLIHNKLIVSCEMDNN